MTGGTNAEIRGTADVNYIEHRLYDTAAVRLNLMGQRNNVEAGISPAQQRAWRLLRLRPRHRHGVDAEISAPAGRAFRIRHPVPVRGTGAGRHVPYALPSNDPFKTEVEIVTGKVRANSTRSRSASRCVMAITGSIPPDQSDHGIANCFRHPGPPTITPAHRCAKPVGGRVHATTTFNPSFPVLGTPFRRFSSSATARAPRAPSPQR